MTFDELKFKAEDFSEYLYYEVEYDERPTAGRIAEIANRILSEMLARAPEVFHHCRTNYTCPHGRSGLWSGNTTGSQKTYKARLVCVEEIGR